MIEEFAPQDESNRIANAFNELCKLYKLEFEKPLPKYLYDSLQDYYAHFPIPQYTSEGEPIVPEAWKKADHPHEPERDGNFLWETQGTFEEAKKHCKPFRDPPIKTLTQIREWSENSDSYISTFQLFDWDSLHKELDNKYNMEELKKKLSGDPEVKPDIPIDELMQQWKAHTEKLREKAGPYAEKILGKDMWDENYKHPNLFPGVASFDDPPPRFNQKKAQEKTTTRNYHSRGRTY